MVEFNRVKAETCLLGLRAWDPRGPEQERIRWDTGEIEECAGGKETQEMGSTLSGNLAVRVKKDDLSRGSRMVKEGCKLLGGSMGGRGGSMDH